jgi:hypothetical protein
VKRPGPAPVPSVVPPAPPFSCSSATRRGLPPLRIPAAPTVEQRAATVVRGVDKAVGGLTDEQKARATEIFIKQFTDIAALRQDKTLSPDQLTEKSVAIYKAAQDARSGRRSRPGSLQD